jgi:hypothetical protein
MIKIPMVVTGELTLDLRCNNCQQEIEATIIKNDKGFLILIDADHVCPTRKNNVVFLKEKNSDD